jgi:hypothetical protein
VEREPLWASGLASQPRPDYDVIVRVLDDEPDDEPLGPQEPQPSPPSRRVVVAGAVAIVVLLLAIATEGRGSLMIVDVPSGWGEVDMTCRTERLEEGDRAVERFWCRAIGGRPLPAGTYRSPGSQWTSDITRRDAEESWVRISRDGEVEGWATYKLERRR